MPGYIVGIDLGTTNSCVAVYRNNTIEAIEEPTGLYTVPSIVSFGLTEKHVGKPAADQKSSNYQNTVFGVKRFIGHTFDDARLQSDKMLWPFKIIQGDLKQPLIEVECFGEIRRFYPEEISAYVLSYIREFVSSRLGESVTDCVITCPAYFTDMQRNATKNAGLIGGWNVLRVINEPTAAAFDFGYQQIINDPTLNMKLFVFDLGGGTFDVSILELSNHSIKTLATGGDSHFGGEDFDNILIEHFLNIVNTTIGYDLRDKKKSKYVQLRNEVIKCKEALANVPNVTINLQDIASQCDNVLFTVADMNKICSSLFAKCLPPIEKVLQEAKLTPQDITKVLLVGGATRLSKVKEIVTKHFGQNKVSEGANPDQAVARGAAFAAAMSIGNKGYKEQQVTGKPVSIYDITSHSLGYLSKTGVRILIPKFSLYPCSKQHIVTKQPGKDSLQITVYQGESPDASQCERLGNVRLDNLDADDDDDEDEPTQYQLTLSIDENAILSVSCKQLGDDEKEQSAQLLSGALTTQQVVQLSKEHIILENKAKEIKDWEYYKSSIIDQARTLLDIIEMKEGDGEDVCSLLPSHIQGIYQQFHTFLHTLMKHTKAPITDKPLFVQYEQQFNNDYAAIKEEIEGMESFDW